MALSHVVLHVTLCQAAMRVKPQAVIPMQLLVTDRVNRHIVEQQFKLVREINNTANVAFDMPWGIYRVDMQAKAAGAVCSTEEYFAVVMDHNRQLDVTLQNGPVRPGRVPTLVMGAAPFAFAYVQPTVVAFDKSQQCNQPVGEPLNANISLTNDSDAYYGQFFPNAQLAPHAPLVVAVRLTDARGNFKYVRISGDFLSASSGWPSSGTFNVDENVIDYVSDKPEDTLLCPKMYKTITH